MIEKGTYVVAGDEGARDMYIGKCMEYVENEVARNIPVEVLHMIRYPMQRAIMHSDSAKENPPLLPGVVCLLRLVRRAGVTDIARAEKVPYEESMRAALKVELESAEGRLAYWMEHPQNQFLRVDPREVEILRRHAQGDFRGSRSILTRR